MSGTAVIQRATSLAKITFADLGAGGLGSGLDFRAMSSSDVGGYTSGGLPEIVTGRIPFGGYRAYYAGVRP